MITDKMQNKSRADTLPKLFVSGVMDSIIKKFTDSQFQETSRNNCEFILHNGSLRREPSSNLVWEFFRSCTEKSQLIRKLNRISQQYSETKKKVIVVSGYDYEHELPHFENLIILRFSLRASCKRENEFVVPHNIACLPKPFSYSVESSKPTIGFCGWTKKRKEILEAFENSRHVETVFIKRNRFWGGRPGNKELKREYYQNMKATQFNVCQRGYGNFSIRFYQTLAAGRIPVLVDTDMILPLDSIIPWREVVVMEQSVQDCVDKVIELQRNGKVRMLQQRCAEIFHEYLAPGKFFPFLSRQFTR